MDQDSVSVERRAAAVCTQLRALRQQQLSASIELLRQAFPEVVTDAERFVESSNCMPWDFGVALSGGEEGVLRDKYGVPPGRSRPHHDAVPPLTDMFCLACEHLGELQVLQRQHVEESASQ